MANLQVRNIDENLYESIRVLALNEKRSISQEVVYILERYLAIPRSFSTSPTDEFLKLAGSWEDDRDAEEIVSDIRNSRRNSDRLGKIHEIFD